MLSPDGEAVDQSRFRIAPKPIEKMGFEALESSEKIHWESAHVCPACNQPTPLKELALGEATTGIISCPKCPWSGQINIQIIEEPAQE